MAGEYECSEEKLPVSSFLQHFVAKIDSLRFNFLGTGDRPARGKRGLAKQRETADCCAARLVSVDYYRGDTAIVNYFRSMAHFVVTLERWYRFLP